jgi:putative Mn2+ efflux pump MntP
MNWRRLIAFVGWTAVLVPLFFVTAFVTLMGDCPEHVIYGWHGGTTCSDHKRIAAWSVLIGFPLLWLLGTVLIFRRWSR